MAKRKPGRPRKPIEVGETAPSRSGKTLFVYIDPALRDALDLLLGQSRRSLTAEVSLALESHLRQHNLWPPKKIPSN